MKTTAESMMFSVEKIAEMSTWQYYQGFVGETCGNCRKTANVLAGGPGWICPCGHYNAQLLCGGPMPHEIPDYGPTAETIRKGHSGNQTT